MENHLNSCNGMHRSGKLEYVIICYWNILESIYLFFEFKCFQIGLYNDIAKNNHTILNEKYLMETKL